LRGSGNLLDMCPVASATGYERPPRGAALALALGLDFDLGVVAMDLGGVAMDLATRNLASPHFNPHGGVRTLRPLGRTQIAGGVSHRNPGRTPPTSPVRGDTARTERRADLERLCRP